MKPTVWAIFSDVHSNLEALQAVIQDIRSQNITNLLCLGDIVGYNANPSECVELVRGLDCPVIQGNHDALAACADDEALREFNPVAMLGVLYSREHLGEEHKKWLLSLPLTLKWDDFGAVHSSLFRPEEWYYVVNALDARIHFQRQDLPLYFIGHTHTPAVFQLNKKDGLCEMIAPRPDQVEFKPEFEYLVNVGSVGQPRDRDPRACYGVLDLDKRSFQYRRVAYDVDAASRKITAAGLPEKLSRRIFAGT